MRRMPIWTFLIVAAFLSVVGSAHAEQDEPREIHVTALNVGDEYWFQVDGIKGGNPAIRLAPGEKVQVTLDNAANTGHNIRFGQPLDQEMPIQEPGKQDTLTFLVPEGAAGESAYWCQPHRSLGMKGRVVFGQETGQADAMNMVAVVGLSMMIFVGTLRSGRRPAQPL